MCKASKRIANVRRLVTAFVHETAFVTSSTLFVTSSAVSEADFSFSRSICCQPRKVSPGSLVPLASLASIHFVKYVKSEFPRTSFEQGTVLCRNLDNLGCDITR